MMGLLDGALQAIAGRVFGGILLAGTLHKATEVDDGKGGYTTTFVDHPIRGARDACTEAMRREAGYVDTDARLIVLQLGVMAVPNTDDQITLQGQRWSIASVDSDPASTHWVMRGQLA
ncbi:MAG: hypothetical protein DI537_23770 [Stutzerimonas stutzeri]|nr:MAG: hypothetical protein DI537_23770 [Stutzerimonas stutzeri]